jgi:4-amino-4-deoxy-L-arabinose transferase-like glycosyltransferase
MKPSSPLLDFLERQSNQVLALGMIFVLALLILAPGIGELTAATGKDEYRLGLRVPLTMMEQDRWLIPWLDGAPRLQKPPLLYWLGRASYELFGPSLAAGRAVAIFLSAILVIATALIARELTGNRRYALFSALILFSLLAFAVEGRRLMLDLPCATFSALSFYFFLRWRNRPRVMPMLWAALFFAAGFLTKGPVVALLLGAGLVALAVSDEPFRKQLWSGKVHLLVFLLLAAALSASWYLYAAQVYPEHFAATMQEEAKSRKFFEFYPTPITALIIISFPWVFVLFRYLVFPRRVKSQLSGLAGHIPFLIIWLLITVVPFFFFKSFVRYMAGSIVPIALLCATLIEAQDLQGIRWPARAGMLLAAVIIVLFCGFSLWFGTATTAPLLTLAVLAVFMVVWWRVSSLEHMVVSATLLWLLLFGFVYPGLGVNAIPGHVIEYARDREPIMYGSSQPAMLPIALTKSIRRPRPMQREDLQTVEGRDLLIFLREKDIPSFQKRMQEFGLEMRQVGAFRTLSSRKGWIKFARKDATFEDWKEAIRTRSLAPIQSTIVMYTPVSKP